MIVDDNLLLLTLAGQKPATENSEIFTTGCWYYRLGRAIHDSVTTGTLSRAFAELNAAQQTKVLNCLDELPSGIGLVSLRYLVPVMQQFDQSLRLNLLASEALAAALLLEASIRVSTPNPCLRKLPKFSRSNTSKTLSSGRQTQPIVGSLIHNCDQNFNPVFDEVFESEALRFSPTLCMLYDEIGM